MTLVGHKRLLFLELKSAKGRVTTDQLTWLEALAAVETPPQVEVVRPADLDRILDMLQRKGA